MLNAALARWRAPRRAQLLAAYPPPVAGFHRRWFAAGRVSLTLLYGPVETMLNELCAGRFDAWYLDGFSPARNPAMWRPQVMTLIARLSATGATVASYTVAGTVRRALREAGFSVSKRPGFGAKREMLSGVLDRPTAADHCRPAGARRAAVIGAGLAGCALGESLCRRGWRVSLFEQAERPATAASAIGAAVLMPRLTLTADSYSRFYLLAYLHSLALLAQLDDVEKSACGVLQLADDEPTWRRQQRLATGADLPATLLQAADAEQTETLTGVALARGGLWFPGGGWVNPASFCRALLKRAGLRPRYGHVVTGLTRRDGRWRLDGDHGGADAEGYDAVLIAAGHHSARFAVCAGLPLNLVRGQTSRAAAGPHSRRLRAVLSHRGYLTPAHHGGHSLGATFQRDDLNLDARPSDDAANLSRLAGCAPQLAAELGVTLTSQHVGLRAATPDRLPLAGPIPDLAACRTLALTRDRRRSSEQAARYPGLYLATGLGARGAIAAPLLAELLAARLSDEPLPLARTLVDALDPARFFLRALRRGRTPPS